MYVERMISSTSTGCVKGELIHPFKIWSISSFIKCNGDLKDLLTEGTGKEVPIPLSPTEA